MVLLHYTAEYANLDCVKYLVENGANIEAQCDRGYTPLHYAVNSGSREVVKCLVIKGADISAETWEGYIPADAAIAIGDLYMVVCLTILKFVKPVEYLIGMVKEVISVYSAEVVISDANENGDHAMEAVVIGNADHSDTN